MKRQKIRENLVAIEKGRGKQNVPLPCARKRLKRISDSEPAAPQSELDVFPPEIAETIISFLSLDALSSFSLTSAAWNDFVLSYFKRELAKSNSVYSHLFDVTNVKQFGSCIKMILSPKSFQYKIDYLATLIQDNEFLCYVEVELWKTISEGWPIQQTVDFTTNLYQRRDPIPLEKTRKRTAQRKLEDVASLAYELVTIWACDRSLEFCRNATDKWTTDEKAVFLDTLYKYHLEDDTSGNPNISFICKVAEKFTENWTSANRYELFTRMLSKWDDISVQEFLQEYPFVKDRLFYKFLKSQTKEWNFAKLANYVVNITAMATLEGFVELLRNVTKTRPKVERLEVMKHVVLTLKVRYLTFNCNCGECRHHYFDRISALAILGLEKIVSL